MYKEVVEVRSNYKKSYFSWFENPACGDSAGMNQIEKDILYLLNLFEGMGKKGHCDLVCVKRLYMIGLMLIYVGVLYTWVWF